MGKQSLISKTKNSFVIYTISNSLLNNLGNCYSGTFCIEMCSHCFATAEGILCAVYFYIYAV